MRILVASNYYSEKAGGIEFVALKLVREFRSAGHDVRWVACDLRDRPHCGAPEDVPLRAWNIAESKLGIPYPLPHPIDLWRLRQHVRWCDVAHVHDSLYVANQWISWCAARYAKPIVVTQHVGLVPYRERYKMWSQRAAHASVGRLVLQRAAQVAFVADPVRRWFVERIRFRRPPVVIPPGVDVSMFYPLSATEREAVRAEAGLPIDRPVILFVGRFTHKKGVHLIREVARATPQWCWLLIGDAIEEDPGAWSLPNVRVLPPQTQSNLRRFYSAADLLVLPSVGEGFPQVIGEAMACGTMVVICPETAQAVPGLSECVFTTAPDRISLQAAVETALTSVNQRQRIQSRMAEFVRDVLNWQTLAARYLEIFRLTQPTMATELSDEKNFT